MKITSALAIYVLFWVMSLFVMLPLGVRTSEEAGVKPLPGHAESAPHTFSLGKVALRTTIVATALFALFVANYIFGWITVDMLDWVH